MFNNLLTILLQDTGQGKYTMVFLLLMIAVFYFFMILPQVRKNKAQKKYREGLNKGEKVVTVGGIHGKISEVKETYIIVDAGNGVKLKIEKSGISTEASMALNKEVQDKEAKQD